MTIDSEAARPSEVLAAHRHDILRIATRFHSRDVRVFGSVARGEDGPGSDLDLLVRFEDHATAFDLVEMQDAWSALLEISVDVVSEGGLHGRNRAILDEAVPL